MAAAKGNQYAAKERRFLSMLQRVLDHEGDGNALRRIALKLIERAEEGESWAIQQIADRLDGKPTQQLDLGGELAVKTYRDLGDDVLAQIAGRALPDRGKTVQ